MDVIDLECRFCKGRCFVPLLQCAPNRVKQQYRRRKINLMATCDQGKDFEKALFGVDFDDVLAAVPEYLAYVVQYVRNFT